MDKSYEELAKTRVWTKKQHEAKAAPSEHVLVDDLLRSVHPSHLDDLYKLSRNEDDALLIRCGWDDYQQGTGPEGPETQLAYQEGCVITLRRAAFEHARLHGSESDSLPADEGSATSVYTQSLGAMLINQISRHRNAGKSEYLSPTPQVYNLIITVATDVRLNAKYCSKTFEELFAQGELATWKDGDSYVCVGMDACVELAKSPQAGDCIGNAETWKLLNVLVSLMLEYGTSDSGSEMVKLRPSPDFDVLADELRDESDEIDEAQLVEAISKLNTTVDKFAE